MPFYVFGHPHEAEQFPLAALGERGPEPRYLNSWTRTSVVGATGFDLLRARERFTFVQITRDPERGTPVGRLMHWHAAAGRADVLPVMQG